jgi:hypothetical protein
MNVLSTTLVKIQISIRVGYGSTKLPSSDLKGSDYLTEVYSRNGVRSNDTLTIYEVPGIDPETQEEVMLSPSWAKNKLTAMAQEVQEAYSTGGDLYPQEFFVKVNEQIRLMQERCQVLLETLLEPGNWDRAEMRYKAAIHDVFNALESESQRELDRQLVADPLCSDIATKAHELRLSRYEMSRNKMLRKFPTQEEFTRKFRVTNSEPEIKESIMNAIAQNAEAVETLAKTQAAKNDLQFVQAVQESRRRALEDFQLLAKERTEELYNEFFGHIQSVLSTLDRVDKKEVSDRTKLIMSQHVQRTEAVLHLIAGLSQYETDLTQEDSTSESLAALSAIAQVTKDLQDVAAEANESRETLKERLRAFRLSLGQNVQQVSSAESAAGLAEWCLLDAADAPATPTPTVQARPAEIILPENDEPVVPAFAPVFGSEILL